MISEKNKKTCTTLNYIKHFLILDSAVTGCILFSALAFLIDIPIGIIIYAIELKACAITARIQKYNSVNKKKKHDKIVLLAKI